MGADATNVVLEKGDSALIVREDGSVTVLLPKHDKGETIRTAPWMVVVASKVLTEKTLWDFAEKYVSDLIDKPDKDLS